MGVEYRPAGHPAAADKRSCVPDLLNPIVPCRIINRNLPIPPGENIVSTSTRVLCEWLTYAEDQSRRNIALLQESGIDATACAQMHSIARIKARRPIRDANDGSAVSQRIEFGTNCYG